VAERVAGPAPDHLPRHLLFAIIAYRIQADQFGISTMRQTLLDRTGTKVRCSNVGAAGQLRPGRMNTPEQFGTGVGSASAGDSDV
jgi:hypothetical protein